MVKQSQATARSPEPKSNPQQQWWLWQCFSFGFGFIFLPTYTKTAAVSHEYPNTEKTVSTDKMNILAPYATVPICAACVSALGTNVSTAEALSYMYNQVLGLA